MSLKRTRSASRLGDEQVLHMLANSGFSDAGTVKILTAKIISCADGQRVDGFKTVPTLSFQAFKRFLRAIPSTGVPDVSDVGMRTYFDAFDYDGDGSIDMREIFLGLMAMDSKIARKHARVEKKSTHTSSQAHLCTLRQAGPRALGFKKNDPSTNVVKMQDGVFATCIGDYAPPPSGKWYYEVVLKDPATNPTAQLGFAIPSFSPPWSNGGLMAGIGDDVAGASFAYDGKEQAVWHRGTKTSRYGINRWNPMSSGTKWTSGDTVGCLLDYGTSTISFSLNGVDLGIAFHGVPRRAYVPAATFLNGPAQFAFAEADMTYKYRLAPDAQCFTGWTETVVVNHLAKVDLTLPAHRRLRNRLDLIFTIYDCDKNGRIDRHEMLKMLTHMIKQAGQPSDAYSVRTQSRLLDRTMAQQLHKGFPLDKKGFFALIQSGIIADLGLQTSDLFVVTP